MTNSLMRWHLARDNQSQLAKFCDKHQIDRKVSDYYQVDGNNCFTHTTYFDNGGYIVAEMVQGTSIAENYQVIDYGTRLLVG